MMPLLLSRILRAFVLLLVVVFACSSVQRGEWFALVISLLLGWQQVDDYRMREGGTK